MKYRIRNNSNLTVNSSKNGTTEASSGLKWPFSCGGAVHLLNPCKPDLPLSHLISNYMTKELTLALQIGNSQRFTRSLGGTDCFEKLVLSLVGTERLPLGLPLSTDWRMSG